ncbi:S-adenosyl-L-methionine-dependent methyltransferase [Basidiobolus meristosporus CBS 931.73]|uniref:S-adenosyl-L-methionine-dependent methyltransferase n=1 Tax=Basidiobolus meristosporus CBS 931.73 TaxID=1314790 RepID=A0A1Y1Y5K3_9FUNG|nr:S-adenosyl-L-methionine-dependent methyltransferase [Basidiobolus meristosporus CBS 931.73]|eukprot:ORX92884.1 S-adenosyl-L-methionine-dependent methyltransferase [Basidiobolus meristosporus CBS 931.73]
MSRPEHQGPPEFVYNDVEAAKYTSNTRIAAIQAEMAFRALELLNLPEDQSCFLLDIGCGSGLSGEILDEEGHIWIGFDIAPAMLDIALEREVEGDLFLQDAGEGMGFRPGTFDGAMRFVISVLQWLCNADKQIHNPKARLARFFSTLFMALKRGARAVFQFYPENDDQIEMIMNAAMKSGFTGGLVIDYPNSNKAKKFYLCLFAGQSAPQDLPKALGEEDESNGVTYANKRVIERRSNRGSRRPIKDKNWVLRKKELSRTRGKENVPRDSKYTARKRKPRF